MGIELIKKRNVIEHENCIHHSQPTASLLHRLEFIERRTEKKRNLIEHAFVISVHVTRNVLQ